MASRGRWAKGIAVASGTTDVTATTEHTTLYGYSFQEDAAVAAVATIVLKDGSGGDSLIFIELPANGSETISFPVPVSFPSGVYVDKVAGSTIGALFTEEDG